MTELLERGCELGGVPGFYIDEETGKWKMDIRGSGIMIPDRNSKGQIESFRVREHNDAHRMIEEAMLVANVSAAKFVLEKKR
mgnify:CR=1 FL=1